MHSKKLEKIERDNVEVLEGEKDGPLESGLRVEQKK